MRQKHRKTDPGATSTIIQVRDDIGLAMEVKRLLPSLTSEIEKTERRGKGRWKRDAGGVLRPAKTVCHCGRLKSDRATECKECYRIHRRDRRRKRGKHYGVPNMPRPSGKIHSGKHPARGLEGRSRPQPTQKNYRKTEDGWVEDE